MLGEQLQGARTGHRSFPGPQSPPVQVAALQRVRTAAEVLATGLAHTTRDGRRAKYKNIRAGGAGEASWHKASLRPPARETWGTGMFSAAAPFFSLWSYRPGREKRLFHRWEMMLGAELEWCRTPQWGCPFPCVAPTCSQDAPTDARALQQPYCAHPDTHTHTARHVCTCTAGHADTAGHIQPPDPLTQGQPLSHRRHWVHTHPPMPPTAPALHPPQHFGVIKVPFEGAYNFY